jgi:hypothetical protein
MQPTTPSLPSAARLMGLGWNARLVQRGHAALVLAALVFSLLLSPLLSRMHHLVHPGHGAAATVAQVANEQEPMAELSAFDRLFGTHTEGSQACQLLDHSGACDGPLPHANVALVEAPLLLSLGQPLPTNRPGRVSFFQARGPPEFL